MELQPCTYFRTLPDACPEPLRKRATAWNARTTELLAAAVAAEAAAARRNAALAAHKLPAAADRGAPRAYRQALEALQEHLATLAPLAEAVAEGLHKALLQARAGAAKSAGNIASRMVTMGFREEDAAGLALRHPDVRGLSAAATAADALLCALPNPQGGSCLQLAIEVDARLAGTEN